MSDALDEILRCIHYPGEDIFRHSSSEEHLNEFHRITETVDRLVPPRIHQNIFCHGGFCGPWIEDMWPGFANSSLSDFTFTVPLVVSWVKMCFFHRCRYFVDIERTLELLSARFLHVTLVENDNGIKGRDFMGESAPNFLVVSGGGKGYILFSYWQGRSIVRMPTCPLNIDALFRSWVISTATGCGPE
jgi:hypothetical protein